MNYFLRRARHVDASGIINSHRRSIREACAKDYNPAQIAAWSGRDFKVERWCQTMDKDMVWVISNEAREIFGFGHLKFQESQHAISAEIAGLYFVPEVMGQGLGKKLVQMMIDTCIRKELSLITLSATRTAREFYQKCGFKQVGEEITYQIGEEAIGCFRMELNLIQSDSNEFCESCGS